jgi:hypothetical protein
MRKGIVVLALAMSSLAVTAAPAAAHHCGVIPQGDPVGWAKYAVCQLTHR